MIEPKILKYYDYNVARDIFPNDSKKANWIEEWLMDRAEAYNGSYKRVWLEVGYSDDTPENIKLIEDFASGLGLEYGDSAVFYFSW